jgi:hypothetical protein
MIKSAVAVVAAITSFSFLPASTVAEEVPIAANGIRVFDPITALPPSVQLQFKCIAYTESRNKLVDTNVVSGAQGMYQFMPEIWQFARENITGLPPTPNEATQIQQNAVAYFYWTRNHGLYPEWTDGC